MNKIHMKGGIQFLVFVLSMSLVAACGSDTNTPAADESASNADASGLKETVMPVAGSKLNPPAKLRIKQGLWGYVTPGQEIGGFSSDPTGKDDLGGEIGFTTPPDEDGFYQLPFEPGESGWFCMIAGPHSDPTLESECVQWNAVEGIRYCGVNGQSWDC